MPRNIVACVIGSILLSPCFASTIDNVTIVSPGNLTQVPVYGKLELLVQLSALPAGLKPYETNPPYNGLDLYALFTPAGGTAVRINGFYDGAEWRIRFAPSKAGSWTFSVYAADNSGSTSWTGGTFNAVASGALGFVKVDRTYLSYIDPSNNKLPIYAVGHNNGWQADVERPSLPDMASRGENLLSHWMAMPWARPSYTTPQEPYQAARAAIENIEGGVGNFNQAACAYFEGLVGRAESAGIYLLPSIWSHGQLRDNNHNWGTGWWTDNPYSTLCSPTDFFKTSNGGVETEQWRKQKNFLRYLVARWGHSPAIAGWVGIVEIDGTTGYAGTNNTANPTQVEAWIVSVRNWMSSLDSYRNIAGAYPLTFSRTDYTTSGTWDGGASVRSMDSYTQQASNINVANAIGTQTRTMRGSGKPIFHAEFGGDLTLLGVAQPNHLHNGMWAGTAAGASITPLLWCDGGHFPMLDDTLRKGPEMRDHLQYLSQFMRGIPYFGNSNFTTATFSNLNSPMRGWGMRINNAGFAWIQNSATNGVIGGQTFSISSIDVGTYRVQYFNAWSSGVTPYTVQTVTVGSTKVLTLTMPSVPGTADVAIKFFVNIAPVASSQAVTVNEDSSISVSALATDANGDTLTYSLLTGPTHGTLSGQLPAVQYTPLPNYNGPDNFTFRANDGALNSNTGTVSINVLPVNDAPTLSYATASPNPGDVGSSIAFSASGSDIDGDALTYSWNFGDGASATGSNAAHSYSAAGDFVATVTVSDGNGGSASQTITVSVAVPANRNPVIVSAVANPNPGELGTTTDFSASAVDPDGDALTYSWDFGDGNTATGASVSNLYADAGQHTAMLTVNDNRGGSDSYPVTVTIRPPNQSPIIVSVDGTPGTVYLGSPITFSAQASDPDGDALAYSWAFGDDTNFVGDSQTAHTYSALGTYTTSVTVTDGRGGSVTGTVVVSVELRPNSAPVPGSVSAVANPTQLGTATAFSATASDPDGDALTYQWSFGDGGSAEGASVSHTYPAAGTYLATVTVSDGSLSVQSSVTVYVNAKPVITAATASPARVATAASVSFAVTASDSDGDALTYSWNFGDSTPAGSGNPVAHSYAAAGTYTATLIVSDNRGGSVSSAVSVTVITPIKINFQPATAPVFAGYMIDSGQVYAARNGYSYGWNVAVTAYDRNNATSPDQRYDTGVDSQAATSWEVAVSNGKYSVKVVAGDPSATGTGYKYVYAIEGVTAVNGVPAAGAARWIEGTVVVTVTDGKLTVSKGTGAKKNRLSFLEITPVP